MLAFNSVDSCELKPGQWFAVVGGGGLGQIATQYAKAMTAKVIVLDVNDQALEMCKEQGADYNFNTKTQPDFARTIMELTGGGVHAAAVYSSATVAYATATSILKIGGLLMMIGITHKPIPVSTLSIVTGRYRVKGENNGIPQRLQRAMDFSVFNEIKPEVELKPLEDLPQMVTDMKAGTATKRRAVVF